MKISQVMLASGFGGAERLFVDLCLALADVGQEVQAICRKGSKSARVLSEQPKVKLQTISVFGSWDLTASWKIARLLAEHNTEIVQAHLARAAIVSGRSSRKLGIPLVVTSHNYIDVKYYKYVTMLLPPTKDQYEHYREKGIEESRLRIIRHFSPLEGKLKAGDHSPQNRRLVALGRLVRKKGFHLLLEAFARLEKRPNINYELSIGGTGPEQEALATQVVTLGLEKQVTMVGWVDDVESFLATGDIFVLPSLEEPFGIVVIEAMAAGLPIVSSNSQGPKEILNSEIAWLCETGDLESLTGAMQLACDNYEDSLKKSEKALHRFQQLYSKQVVIAEFIELYASLLSTQTKPSPP